MSSDRRVAIATSALTLCVLVLSACGGAADSKAPTDGAPAVISVSDATVTEGALTNGTVLTMTNPDGVFCRIAYATQKVSAQAPDDFEAVQGALVQISGVANTPLPLTIVDDNLAEPDETLTVVIALAAGSDARCQLGPKSVATITIVSDDAASLVSIADATINETTGGQALISMTNPAGRTCAVTVTSVNGTAVAPADFTALSGVPFTLAGVGSVPVNLVTANDTAIEPPETFTLTIALAPGSDQQCQLSQAVATVTINSDDAAAVISVADATVTEGAASNQTTISMTNVIAGLSCPLAVTTANGTAVTPGDYAGKSAEAFTLDAASKALPLTIVDDLFVETAETFTVTIALATGADPRCQIGRATATVSIVSNDVASVISIGDVTVAEGATAQLPITMTNPTGVTCNVTATTTDGTAVAPGDYTARSGVLVPISGVASVALAVTTIDDVIVETSEAFTVKIVLAAGSDPRCQIGDDTATVTITSADAVAVVSIADATITEGAAGQTTISMTNFVAGLSCPLTVTTANGTAVAPGDYTAKSAEAFSIDAASKPLALTIVNDILVEPNEAFTVTIALAPGADPRCQIGDGQAAVTIVSNDALASISIADATVTEGAAGNQATISMTNFVAGLSCTLTVTTANGSAVAPGDYTAKSAEAFTLDAASKPLALTIGDDILIETAETFTVTIALAPGADPRCLIGDGQATVTIVSNDAAASISIANATVTEGVAGQTTISMTNFVAGLSCPLTVTTANGTAIAPGDYTAKSAEAFTLDAASKPLALTILSDGAAEPAEIFTVTIVLAPGADGRCQIGDGSATITIAANP